MHPIIAKLDAWGCNMACIHDRFLDDEDFYLSMLEVAAADENYQRLEQALAAADPVQAFERAHALKGSLGNMGLTPLYNPMCRIVDLLRGGVLQDVSQPLRQVEQGRQELARIMESEPQP